MKKLLYYATFFIVIAHRPIYAELDRKTIQIVYNQQQKFVIDLIKHCKTRLPLVAPYACSSKSGSLESLDKLASLLKEHPEALECVMDTLLSCIEKQCINVTPEVNKCLRTYHEMEKNILLPDAQTLQKKFSALVICYFDFQLTPLGTVDYYTQDYLERTNLKTYISLVAPFVNFIGIYTILHYTIKYLDAKYQVKGLTSSDKDEHGILKEISSPIFKTVASAFFVPEIRTTTDKLTKYAQETWLSYYAKTTNKMHKSTYPAKQSKESFATIHGYENVKCMFTPLIEYCAHFNRYHAAGLTIARGYMFEGDLAYGRKLAYALAGEISMQNKNSIWRVVEIHGSSLVNLNLDKVLGDCLEFGPAVLVINNLDWIYTQKEVKPEVYSHIINKLAKYLSHDCTSPIIVIATSKDHNCIDPVMLEAQKLELIKLA